MMTLEQWLAEASRRIKAYESCRLYKYRDTEDVVTIAWGHAMQNAFNDQHLFTALGIDWKRVVDGLIAINSEPENAVEAVISQSQADAIFDADLPGYIRQARASLPPGVFDALDDARRFVVLDLTYNMGPGPDGWGGFVATHNLLARAVQQKQQGHMDEAHALFGEVGDHLEAAAWDKQVGQRAVDDVAMMRSSEWVPPIAA